jgi:hypothetical protein
MQKWQVTFCFLEAAVDELVHAFGENVAVARNPQGELRQILRGLADNLKPAALAIEPRVVARAVQGLITRGVGERKPLVRAQRRERNDVTVGAGAAGNRGAELDQNAWRILVRVADVDRRVGLELRDVGESPRWILDSRRVRLGRGLARQHRRGRRAGCCQDTSAQELASADINELVASLHCLPPLIRRIEPLADASQCSCQGLKMA